MLRHRLNVLRRNSPKRVALNSIDRLLFVGLYRLAPGVLDALKIVRPETLMSWHRAGFRAYWRWKSRPRGGRPKTAADIRRRTGRREHAGRGAGAGTDRRGGCGPHPGADPQLEASIAGGMKAFDTPGLAIGIVANDRLVYARGFGVRSKTGGGRRSMPARCSRSARPPRASSPPRSPSWSIAESYA
jgi:hypothetical protein